MTAMPSDALGDRPLIVVPLDASDRSLLSNEPLGLGLVRLEMADLTIALRGLRPDASPTTIHEARKATKRFRARLRMVGPSLDAQRRRRLLHPARDAAHLLAPLREATVLAGTVYALGDRYGLDAAVVTRAAEALATVSSPLPGPEREVAARGLEDIRDDLRTLEDIADDWETVRPGTERLYRRARKRRESLRDAGDYHDWRKRVKDLRTVFETLRRLWPPLMRAEEEELHRLGQVLGDAHDRAVLADVAGTLALPKADRRLLVATASDDRRRLEARARTRGRVLFAESPDVLSARLAAWWAASRRRSIGGRVRGGRRGAADRDR